MKLTKQVTSLKLSKKLKELGVKQESLFEWSYTTVTGNQEWRLQHIESWAGSDAKIKAVSAFTVAELGERLPRDLYIPYKGKSGKKRKYPQHPHFFFMDGNQALVNYTGGGSQEHLTQKAYTEANARAKMLIYLIENKLVKKG